MQELRNSITQPDLYMLRVRFFKKTDWWKSGWYFEGVLLKPVRNNMVDEEKEEIFDDSSDVYKII